jgi:hypothetical protein
MVSVVNLNEVPDGHVSLEMNYANPSILMPIARFFRSEANLGHREHGWMNLSQAHRPAPGCGLTSPKPATTHSRQDKVHVQTSQLT